jgi:heme oxygenase (mycobilin-producing)
MLRAKVMESLTNFAELRSQVSRARGLLCVCRMIVAVSRFKVEPAQKDALVARFVARSRLVDGHDGFLGLEVLCSRGTSPEFLLITRWASREHMRAYMTSQDFRRVHAGNEEDGADFCLYDQVTE